MTLEELRADVSFDVEVRELQLSFTTTWGLFSPRELDRGSRLLLDRVSVNADDDCLDLGCGYGAIGVALAKLAPRGRTLLVDKDFVAVEYAAKNIDRNGATNAEAALSNSLQHVDPDRRFDLVVANLPAKAGNSHAAVLRHLHEAAAGSRVHAHARLRSRRRLRHLALPGRGYHRPSARTGDLLRQR
jgi:16S rRNA G1207 methylase RsmC